MSNFVQRTLVYPLVSIFCVSATVPSSFAEDAETGPDLWSYEQAYLANLNGFCGKGVWKSGEGSVIKTVGVTYPKIGNANADTIYRKAVESVG